MSLFNLDRFRFEKKSKTEDVPSPSIPTDEEEAAASASLDAVVKDTTLPPSASEDHAATAGEEDDDDVTDHSSRPVTPVSAVSDKTDDSSVPETPEASRPKNLTHFKFRREVIELSSSSDEEEVPLKNSHTKQSIAPNKDVIIISEPSDSEQGEDESVHRNGPAQSSNAVEEEEEEEEDLNDCKLQTLKELFPQKSDQELLQLIESTDTMDEAIAAGLKLAEEGGSKKRKLEESARDDSEDNDDQSLKKKRLDPLQSPENQWEKREHLVSKLHKEFPSLDKEELRDVLREHNWIFQEALESLRVFMEDQEDAQYPSKSDVSNGKELSINTNHHQNDSHMKFRQKSSTKSQNGFRKKDKKKIWSAKKDSQDVEYESASEAGSSLDEDYSSGDEVMEDGYRAKILSFLQDASLGELTLIPQCSQKKAQRIIELRPFNSWEALVSLH
ncbi:hypothetical protein lerEdw1_005407 [Lerista edwardsae]|nr:hypothetical protein lerEdw1_005407 [Lerista edwardsae]